MHLVQSIRPSVALAVATLLSSGCRPERVGGQYGYAVVGPDAQKWGFVADTLLERSPKRVPQRVKRTADQIARDAAANPRCGRFFGDGPYLVTVQRGCGEYSQTHDLSVVAVDSLGVRITQPAAWITGTVRHACPVDRDTAGEAWPRGQRC